MISETDPECQPKYSIYKNGKQLNSHSIAFLFSLNWNVGWRNLNIFCPTENITKSILETFLVRVYLFINWQLKCKCPIFKLLCVIWAFKDLDFMNAMKYILDLYGLNSYLKVLSPTNNVTSLKLRRNCFVQDVSETLVQYYLVLLIP